MQKLKKKTAMVYQLSWGGDMKKVKIELPDDFPTDLLKVDDWFGPQVGELALVHGKIQVVKEIKLEPARDPFKAYYSYSFEGMTEQYSRSLLYRLEVKRGKVFLFNNKPFVHQQALDGGYIEKMARGQKITEYEYERGK